MDTVVTAANRRLSHASTDHVHTQLERELYGIDSIRSSKHGVLRALRSNLILATIRTGLNSCQFLSRAFGPMSRYVTQCKRE